MACRIMMSHCELSQIHLILNSMFLMGLNKAIYYRLCLSVSRYISSFGISKESIVALGYERNNDYVLLAVSILIAGGAYLSIEDTMPRGRKKKLSTQAHSYTTDEVHCCAP